MPASRAPARLWRLGTRVRPAAMPAYERAVTPHPPRPDAQALEEAVKLLQQAHRPVVVAGGGTVWSGAFEELRRLADELHIPVLTTASGRGSIDERHPLALGPTGLYFTRVGRETFLDADLLLILGSRNDHFETGAWKSRPEGARIVQIDIDAAAFGRNWIPDIGVVADVRAALTDILALARPSSQQHVRRASEIAETKRAYVREVEHECLRGYERAKTKGVPAKYRQVFGPEALLEALLLNENGSQDLWSYYSPYFRTPVNGCVPPGAQTCMGAGVAGAVGAKLARPEETVVCISGDGAFQMYMRELTTAAQYRLGITYLVLNNKALGWIKYHQRRNNGRYIASEFSVQPDFAAVAEASGCVGLRVGKPHELQPALERAREANAADVPAVLDIVVDDETAPGFNA